MQRCTKSRLRPAAYQTDRSLPPEVSREAALRFSVSSGLFWYLLASLPGMTELLIKNSGLTEPGLTVIARIDPDLATPPERASAAMARARWRSPFGAEPC